ncbi:DUF262 domain-containing protein [Priestia aryabhattai]|uniref:DUF262 domain-containing protein n=1 Tax=Priestia aryabhattai TaxID=412384 RepID=UPI003D274365
MRKTERLFQKNSSESKGLLQGGILNIAEYLMLFMCLDIPDFQSPFRWTKEKAEQILESVIDNIERDYPENAFFNTVQLFLYRGDASNDRRYVLDGFQRTATILILLCALRDLLFELGSKDRGAYGYRAKKLASSIHYQYIYLNTPDGERYKLRFNENSELLNKYIFSIDKTVETEYQKEDKHKKTYTVENTYKVYKHFVRVIREKLGECKSTKEEYELLNALQSSLLYESLIHVLDSPSANKEWVIVHFIRTNESLTTLKKQTLVKSILLNTARTEREESVVSREYDFILEKFKNDGDVNTLLKYFFASRGEDVSVGRIPSKVKNFIKDNEMSPEDFVNYLKTESEHFHSYFNPQPDNWITIRLYNIVSSLKILKVKQVCPIFTTMREKVRSPMLQENLAELLLKVNLVRGIYGLNPNELTPATIKVVKKLSNPTVFEESTRVKEAIQVVKEKMMPQGVTLEEFRERLNGPIHSNHRSNVLLRMIEWEKSEDEVYYPPPNGIGLEHIQPKILDNKWKIYLFKNEKDFSEEEWEIERERIGNKALMDNNRNKKERQNLFVKKQLYYKKSIFKTTRELGKLSCFREQERNARQKQLVNNLCEIFADVFPLDEELKLDDKILP